MPSAPRRIVSGERARAAVLVAVSLSLLPAGCFSRRYREGPRVAFAGGDPIVQMKDDGKMPSIDRAWMVPLARHTRKPDEDDRVLGIVVGGQARAYPLGLLDRFEVVNDDDAALPLVVVRCGLTNVTAAWDRRIAGETLRFETTGALWRDTLVFRDRETGSLWTAATGRAIAGPLAGESLRAVPGIVTRGDRWEEVHPESLYLDLGEDTAAPMMMKIYRVSPMQGVSGEKTADRRHRGKQEMFVVESGDEALAFTAGEIERRDTVETELTGARLTIRWEPALSAPRVFSGEVEKAAIPMFWFAVARHFPSVRTLPPSEAQEPAPESREIGRRPRC